LQRIIWNDNRHPVWWLQAFQHGIHKNPGAVLVLSWRFISDQIEDQANHQVLVRWDALCDE
jgi:hypothetical protein